MITGPLCKAARALVEIDRSLLAEKARVAENLITDFEEGSLELPHSTNEALTKVLESFGSIFIPESDGLGVGVRLKFSRAITDELEDMDNEGGPARSDDVP